MAKATQKPPTSITFEKALVGYWLEKKRDMSRNTYANYQTNFVRFQEFVKNAPVSQINSDHVRRFLNYMAGDLHLAGHTCLNAWTALSSFWTWAEKELKVPHIISGIISQPKVAQVVIETYTETEIKALFAATEYNAGWTGRAGGVAKSLRPQQLRDRAIIAVLLDTGVRAAELCNLQIKDLTDNRLHVRQGKGNKDRFVYMGKGTEKHLWRYLKGRESKATDPLFITNSGRPMDKRNLLRMITAAAKRSGVKHAFVHKFRHTFAINFLRNGGNLLELQAMLGHEKLETVKIYAKLAGNDIDQAIKRASPVDKFRL